MIEEYVCLLLCLLYCSLLFFLDFLFFVLVRFYLYFLFKIYFSSFNIYLFTCFLFCFAVVGSVVRKCSSACDSLHNLLSHINHCPTRTYAHYLHIDIRGVHEHSVDELYSVGYASEGQ